MATTMDNGVVSIQAVPQTNRLLGVREVAAWLNVSEAWVRAHANGTRYPPLPSIKLGGLLRFRRESVQAFIDRYAKDSGQ